MYYVPTIQPAPNCSRLEQKTDQDHSNQLIHIEKLDTHFCPENFYPRIKLNKFKLIPSISRVFSAVNVLATQSVCQVGIEV